MLQGTRERGLTCLTRNYRSRCGELDLVLDGNDGLVIVEMRYRSRADYGRAAKTVTTRKQARILAAAQSFRSAHPVHAERPIRFDVVGVGAAGELDWIENALQAC